MRKVNRRSASKPARKTRKAGRNRVGDGHAIILATDEPRDATLPRARIRLRSAMRKVGLDEWKIAWLLNYKIDCFAESETSSDNKLLLDYLKEAARHLDPASPRATAEQEASTIEIVHDVPRPNRSEPDEQQI
ncbi:MAG TPA: hypothetical protein VKT50_01105 [Candidatus Acidoferrales bacterium]|nr:hypothetical protein [Candidatus Acidoferrales bacterium]